MAKMLSRLWDFIISASACISGIGLLCLMLIVVGDVILRHTFQSAIPGSMSFTSMIMAISIFFGLGKSQADKQHISVDFFIDRVFVSKKSKQSWKILTCIAAVVFFGIILWESIGLFKMSFMIKEYYGGAKIRVPIYPAKGALMIGFFLIVIQLIKDIIELINEKINAHNSQGV